MKGIQGLVIAILLGFIGFAFNMVYLKTNRDFDHAKFIGVRKGADVRQGTRITKTHLEEIKIPNENVGNLREYALPWGDLDAVVGRTANRNYEEVGGFLLRSDFRTAPDELDLVAKESAISVPIDTRTTVTSQIVPGSTRLAFYLSPQNNRELNDGNDNWTKPFEVLAIGHRLGSRQISNSQGVRSSNENMVTLKATNEQGETSQQMKALLNHLTRNNFKPLRVKIYAPKGKQ